VSIPDDGVAVAGNPSAPGAGARRLLRIVVLALGTLALASAAHAQYFGRNKVQYRDFDFRVLKTEHFDVYYYEEERRAAEQAARMAERWYARLARTLDHELRGRQPLILYASHPHFQQTNAIRGELGEGTGGVTEIFKRRIVLPLAGSLAETDHVIGHELVHAFQFDITGQPRGAIGFMEPSAVRLPLWFIEGMAEFLSIGPTDPQTAMWLRDAASTGKLPTVGQLGNPRYFPYRWGHALWAYIAGRWGDDAVGRVLKATGRNGEAGRALESVLGTSLDSLSRDWHAAIRAWNASVAATVSGPGGARALTPPRGQRGRLNVSPSLSPDGQRIIFLSERDLLSVEMFLADARSGRVIRRITRTAVDPHLQSLQFIHSAGAWSQDGARFAFAALSEGRPVLSIVEAASGRTLDELRFERLDEIFHPTWSPDGSRIAFSAMAGGVSDLFVVELASRRLDRLTDDAFADLQPAWSPDGRAIAFATDRFGTRLDELVFGAERLALVDPDTRAIRAVTGTEQGKNINPQWSPDGRDLLFVADRGGIANVYRVPVAGGAVRQITDVLTGVSGITRLSPALTVARGADAMVFSMFQENGTRLFALDGGDALAGRAPDPAPGTDPAALPSGGERSAALQDLIRNPSIGLTRADQFQDRGYRAGLSLDYVAPPTLGVAGGTNGVAVGGGTALYWSDMLGNHNLTTALQMSNYGGSFQNNVAGLLAYENLSSRLHWGGGVLQLPYLTRRFEVDSGTLPSGEPATREREFRFWQIDRQVLALLAYPFSRVQRVELGLGYRNIDFTSEVQTRIFSDVTGELLSDVTEPLPEDSLPALQLGTANLALVYDNTLFGGTGPVVGQRYRLEAAPTIGDLQYVGALGDLRRYQMLLRPLGVAGRVLHFGRYGSDAEDQRLSPVFVGSPWLLHGYDEGSFTVEECGPGPDCPAFDRLLGSRLAVANLELRLPLLGALGVVPSAGFPPVEMAGFYDVGVAWTDAEKAGFLGGPRDPVTSWGAALRVNLLGFAVGEIALVHPQDRPIKGWYWQFALQPGF
jgi:WD40 repeat protein